LGLAMDLFDPQNKWHWVSLLVLVCLIIFVVALILMGDAL